MTLPAGAANSLDQGETPGSVEHEQLLGLLIHLELVEGVVHLPQQGKLLVLEERDLGKAYKDINIDHSGVVLQIC